MAKTSSHAPNIENLHTGEGVAFYQDSEASVWSELLLSDGLHAVFPQTHQEVMQVHGLLDSDVAELFIENFWWLKDIRFEGAEPPFMHKRQTETHAIGEDLPEVCIYNFDRQLTDKDREAIKQSYDWFSGITGGRIYEFARVIQLGANLGFAELPNGVKYPVGGVRYMATKDVHPIAISEGVMQGETRKRYKNLTDEGVSALEIVLSHEKAHALTYWYPQILERYKQEVDWQNSPVNEYPQGRVVEDIAEAFVYLRFLPDALTEDRVTSLTKSLRNVFGRSRHKQPPSKMILLPEALYPHIPIDGAVSEAVQRAKLLQELTSAHLL